MSKIYYDSDAEISVLYDKTIGIIGYGNQGRSQALNMRDSGVKNILIGTSRDSTWELAKKDGFFTDSVENVCSKSDIIFLLVPDEAMPTIYKESVEPNLKKNSLINFASGYNITFKNIVPRKDLDVVMVAPRMIGDGVRTLFLSKEGYPSFLSIHQDITGEAKTIALGLAKAMGATMKYCLEVDFDDETYIDLMAEQAIWPLIMSIFDSAFKFQVSKGHSKEAVLTELILSKEAAYMCEKMADVGIFKQLPLHSRTSQYGQLTGFKNVNRDFISTMLEKTYLDIVSGDFNTRWLKEQKNGFKNFESLREEAFNNEISKAEDDIKQASK